MTDELLVIPPRRQDLGGFSVRRLLPHKSRRMVGPWIFFDHMGPADFPPGPGINVRPHPHIHLATVTYLFEGEILHRDSLGSVQPIRPGDINLMIAGRGIVHSERESAAATTSHRRLHGLQLWLALPVESEDTEPRFLHYPGSSIPTAIVGHVPVRVMMVRAYGCESPVTTLSETLYAEARLSPGQLLPLPGSVDELAVYVVAGRVRVGDKPIEPGTMVVVDEPAESLISAAGDSIVVMIGGAPLGERRIWWNFVSSRQAAIDKARLDWQEGRFPKVRGDADEFIPLPDAGS
jgi:redox-sensitive bicupin YhaK (pirin superfamily)